MAAWAQGVQSVRAAFGGKAVGTKSRMTARNDRKPIISRLAGGDLDSWLSQQLEPALVLFDASWSAACRLEFETLVALAAHFSGRLRIGALDAGTHPEVSRRVGIAWVPTLILFDSGVGIARWEGARNADESIREIELALSHVPDLCSSSSGHRKESIR